MSAESGETQQQQQQQQEQGLSGENLPRVVKELPVDVWRVVWRNLSPTQLLRAAGVNKQWRRECLGNRRDAALALVMAPDTLPDSDLSKAQQALRGIQRILNRQNPFSGEPLPLSGPSFA